MSLADQALALVREAAKFAPPLAQLLSNALASYEPATDEERTLVAQVKAILPEASKTREAINALGDDK